MAFFQGTKEIREVSGTSFEALASETARKIDLILSEELAQTSQITTDVNIVHTLEVQRDQLADYGDEALQALIAQETQAWANEEPEFVQSQGFETCPAQFSNFFRTLKKRHDQANGESEVGKGTTFIIELPKVRHPM